MPQFLWAYVHVYIYMYILKSDRTSLEIKGNKWGSNKATKRI